MDTKELLSLVRKRLVTTPQAAKLRGVSARAIRFYITKGYLDAYATERDYLIDRQQLMEFRPPPSGNPNLETYGTLKPPRKKSRKKISVATT